MPLCERHRHRLLANIRNDDISALEVEFIEYQRHVEKREKPPYLRRGSQLEIYKAASSWSSSCAEWFDGAADAVETGLLRKYCGEHDIKECMNTQIAYRDFSVLGIDTR